MLQRLGLSLLRRASNCRSAKHRLASSLTSNAQTKNCIFYLTRAPFSHNINSNREPSRAFSRRLYSNATYKNYSTLPWSNVSDNKTNKFDEILQRANSALSSNSKDAAAWAEKGIALLIKREYDEALECATKANKLDPILSTPYFVLGAVSYEKVDYEESVKYMNKFLEVPTSSAETAIANELDLRHYANECLAYTYFATERFNDAIKRFQMLLGSKPSSSYLIYLGEIAEIRKSTSPKEFYEGALKLSPNGAHAMANLGRVMVMNGNTDQGFDMIKKAIEINPNISAVHIALADSLMHVKNYNEAVAAYDKALALPTLLSTRRRALHQKAMAHAQLKQFAAEHATLRSMHVCHLQYCDAVTAYQLNVALQMADQDYDKLMPYMDELIKKYPNDMQLFVNRADVLLLKGQADEARKFFAVSLDRIQDESLQQFATCKMIRSFARLGQLQHIAHLFEPTIKWLKKNEDKNYTLLAELLSDIAQFGEALKYADLAIESLLSSTDTVTLDRAQGYRVKASVLEANHDVDGAVESYERVLEINPHEQQSMEHLARLYIRQSRADDALKMIDRLLEERPNDTKFIDLKRGVQALK